MRLNSLASYETKKDAEDKVKKLEKDVADGYVSMKRYRGFCADTENKC